jgi:hypothetical protein
MHMCWHFTQLATLGDAYIRYLASLIIPFQLLYCKIHHVARKHKYHGKVTRLIMKIQDLKRVTK